MMAVNRLSQINMALSQASSVLNILYSIIKLKTGALDAEDKLKVLYKELTSSSNGLASTLTAKREFAESLGNGEYRIDPRFMLFEFCHNILLRKAQVDLVRKLSNQLNEGNSVCHQVRY
jgi:hypothetical protein